MGREPYFDEERQATDELILDYIVPKRGKQKKEWLIKRALESLLKTLIGPIYCPPLKRLIKQRDRNKKNPVPLSKGKRTATIL